MIGGVGDGDEQLVATAPQRQSSVLPNQLLTDQFPGLCVFVDGAQIQECDAELLCRHLGQVPAFQQFVLHQVGNQRNLVALCLGMRLQGAALIEEVGQY
ncbi:hypothetical protein D9M69_472620 [compost metagenome]